MFHYMDPSVRSKNRITITHNIMALNPICQLVSSFDMFIQTVSYQHDHMSVTYGHLFSVLWANQL